jgi:transcriptional regulator with XRE-family HTH domain
MVGRAGHRYGVGMTAAATTPPVGVLLRQWRERRRISQLDLALQADISARHLSFVETGRSKPTSAMIRRLAEQLDVPLRERNTLLLAGGFAPGYRQRELDAPELGAVQRALRQVLAGHDPFPAVVVNRWWELVEGNSALNLLLVDVAPSLLEPPVNVLRVSLHPDGMAPGIVNLPEWRGHVLARLHRQAVATGDRRLVELHDELRAYPGGVTGSPSAADVVVPLRFRRGADELSFFSMTAIFGTPMDVTVEELAIELFYPADQATDTALRRR